MKKIPLFKPSHDGREEEALAKVLRSGWTGLGQVTEEFEKRFAQYVGSKYAVATNSCTAALQLAFHLSIPSNHEPFRAIIPSITFCSTAHAANAEFYNLSFADINPNTLMLDCESARQVREDNLFLDELKVVVPVLYGGQTPDPEWEQLGSPLIYDCAHACGAEFSAAGKVCCWSFHSVKNLSCGDGGMLTTDNKEMADRARGLRWMGITRSTFERAQGGVYQWYYDIPEFGYKCHMNDLTAAIGLVQLEKMPRMQANRKEMAQLYRSLLWEIHEENPSVLTQVAFDEKGSQHLVVVMCRERDRLSDFLAGRGITTGVHYKPLHLHQCYGRGKRLPHAENMFNHILSLPMYADMGEEEVREVCNGIRAFYA